MLVFLVHLCIMYNWLNKNVFKKLKLDIEIEAEKGSSLLVARSLYYIYIYNIIMCSCVMSFVVYNGNSRPKHHGKTREIRDYNIIVFVPMNRHIIYIYISCCVFTHELYTHLKHFKMYRVMRTFYPNLLFCGCLVPIINNNNYNNTTMRNKKGARLLGRLRFYCRMNHRGGWIILPTSVLY